MKHDYWWVTRPKRRLASIPAELAAFFSIAQDQKWTGCRRAHIAFEELLESSGTKRTGERRDAAGSGGRTHAAMLYSLGLWFELDGIVHPTLAGEALMNGGNAVEILKKQILNYQYPSPYSKKRQISVSDRFRLRPFIFLLKLLCSPRLGGWISQEEIAFVAALKADEESSECVDAVVNDILRFREAGRETADSALMLFGKDYFSEHGAKVPNLMDIANTAVNWLDFTQLIKRSGKIIELDPEKRIEVENILDGIKPLIKYPVSDDIYQRKYGVDPSHRKDTRNLLDTKTITANITDRNLVMKAFMEYASLHPVTEINADVVEKTAQRAGVKKETAEKILLKTYPNCSSVINLFLIDYREMAFKGRDEAVDFEKATANIFSRVFGYKAQHLGQTGAKSAPDVLLFSDSDGYQAVIDNKAYSRYSISGDHHNRMVYSYIRKISSYSQYSCPIGFFAYISGGFAPGIDGQIRKEASEAGVHGSGAAVSVFIKLIEKHMQRRYTHSELRKIFSLDREIHLSDIER